MRKRSGLLASATGLTVMPAMAGDRAIAFDHAFFPVAGEPVKRAWK